MMRYMNSPFDRKKFYFSEIVNILVDVFDLSKDTLDNDKASGISTVYVIKIIN